MERKKIATTSKKNIKSFEGSKKKAEDLEDATITHNVKGAGRKIKGKSKVSKEIRFAVDDEMHEWLESLTNTKERTPHAVCKKILVAQYELNNG